MGIDVSEDCMNFLWRYLYQLSRAKLQAKRGPPMVCSTCGLLIHRHDRFRVLEVVHISCRDLALLTKLSKGGRPAQYFK
jgi:hypothetical protein